MPKTSGAAKPTTAANSAGCLWKKHDILTDRAGHKYLVIHVYKNIATIVVDVQTKDTHPLLFAILPRQYDAYRIVE